MSARITVHVTGGLRAQEKIIGGGVPPFIRTDLLGARSMRHVRKECPCDWCHEDPGKFFRWFRTQRVYDYIVEKLGLARSDEENNEEDF